MWTASCSDCKWHINHRVESHYHRLHLILWHHKGVICSRWLILLLQHLRLWQVPYVVSVLTHSHTADALQAQDLQSVWETEGGRRASGRTDRGGPLRRPDGQLVPAESHLLRGGHFVPHHPLPLQQVRGQHADCGEWKLPECHKEFHEKEWANTVCIRNHFSPVVRGAAAVRGGGRHLSGGEREQPLLLWTRLPLASASPAPPSTTAAPSQSRQWDTQRLGRKCAVSKVRPYR